jgi:Small Multidrug Resistance protein
MPWINLFGAGLLEVFCAISLKYTDGFSRPRPSLLTAIGMILAGIIGLKLTFSWPSATQAMKELSQQKNDVLIAIPLTP